MESFLFIHLHQRALPGTKSSALKHIAEQHIARAIIERVRDDQLSPALQGYIEGIGIFKLAGFALKNQLLSINAEVAQQAVRNMSVPQLILNNRESRAKIVQRRRVNPR